MKNRNLVVSIVSPLLLGLILMLTGSVSAEMVAIWDFGPDAAGFTLDVTEHNVLGGEPTLFMAGGAIDMNGKDGVDYVDSQGQLHSRGQAATWNDIKVTGKDAEWILMIDTRGWKDLAIRWDYKSEGSPSFDLDYRLDITGDWIPITNNELIVADSLWRGLNLDLSGIAEINNQSTVEFRFNDLDNEGNYQYRFDNLELTGTPDPEFAPNAAPQVSAGNDLTIDWPDQSAQLNGTASDDGKPNPPGSLTTMWQVMSGPGDVIFEPDKFRSNPTVSFSMPGTYILKLSADDGELIDADEIIITAQAGAIYVDSTASGGNDGSSWVDAFNRLADALAIARQSNSIWVAEGTYYPTAPGGDPRVAFDLKSGIRVYGGFPVGGGTWADRNPAIHKTILSGNINHSNPSLSTKSYHVVTCFGVDETTVLNGFTVTDGYAVGADEYANGGGMYCYLSSLTIEKCIFDGSGAQGCGGGVYNWRSPTLMDDCTFRYNNAPEGGGMYNNYSEATIENCTLGGNSASSGAGVFNSFSDAEFTDCSFYENRAAEWDGGGMMNYKSDPTLTGCRFQNNSAHNDGGGITNRPGCSPILIDCVFIQNRADDDGGGIANNGENNPILTNCEFTGNFARDNGGGMFNRSLSNPTLNSCIFRNNRAVRDGGGMYFRYGSSPTLDDNVAFIANYAFRGSGLYMDGGGTVRVVGNVNIESNDWKVVGCKIIGAGRVEMNASSVLYLDNVEVTCDITGPGRIIVDQGQELSIRGDAEIMLFDTHTGQRGLIDCRGLLRLRGNVSVINTRINIYRARFQDDVIIASSVITAVTAEAGIPTGQLFVEDTVLIADNDIYADGDRYLDFDPSVFGGEIRNNRLYVTITEGVGQTRGGLLELRGQPGLATSNCGGFFCGVSPGGIPNFDSSSWTIEELRLMTGAKVNLTNRFDFHKPFDSGGNDEVMYVKKLVMESGSVLNTSFNRIYFQADQIEFGSGAVIKNEPLLGFSLNNIAFGDEVEFLTRIDTNNSDDPNYPRNHVERITGHPLDPSGIMQLRNLTDIDPESLHYGKAVNARAKGLFAKVSPDENEVLILFEYMFTTAHPDVELIVNLSNTSRLLDHDDPERKERYLEVARLKPPLEGQPGSAGSGRFGTFQRYVPRGSLDFFRGCRMELELVGPDGTSVLIDNWDPQVHCNSNGEIPCKDITWDNSVDEEDLLTVIGEIGTSAALTPEGNSRACLEGPFSVDGAVDWFDVEGWCWILGLGSEEDKDNLCGIFPAPTGSASTSQKSLKSLPSYSSDFFRHENHLLVTGKRGALDRSAKGKDRLYVYDQQGQFVDFFEPAFPRANSKVVADHNGDIRQINLTHGLVGISDSNSIIAPAIFENIVEPRYGTKATVGIGLHSYGSDVAGRPISDVAFDSQGFAYVVPVIVDPNGYDAYACAAKLELLEANNPSYRIVQLYDDTDARSENDNRQLDNLREVEVDPAGNLYVINAHCSNESDVLWKYDTATGDMKQRLSLTAPNGPGIPSPAAMYVSRVSPMLYLASSRNLPEATSTAVYVLSTTDLRLVRTVTIDGMGHVTAITAGPTPGSLAVVGLAMSDIPEYPNPNTSPFYHPYLAIITPDSDVADVIELGPDNPDEYNDLAFPTSVLWMGQVVSNCMIEDIDCSGRVDAGDFAILCSQWLKPPRYPSADIAPAPDGDNMVDLLDLEALGIQWLKAAGN